MSKKGRPKVPAYTPRYSYYDGDYIKAVYYTETGARRRISTGTQDMDKAARILNNRMSKDKLNSGEASKEMSLEEAFKKMQALEWRQHKDYRKRMQTAKAILEYFGADTLLSEIDEDLINDYISFLMEEYDNSNSTINRKLAVIKRTMNVAWRQWKKLKTLPYIPILKEKVGGHRKFITEDQFHFILSHVQDFTDATLLRILYETGMRPSEPIESLWTNYDFSNNTVLLVDTKNGEDWLKPFNSKVAEILLELKKINKIKAEEATSAADRVGYQTRPFYTKTISTLRNSFMPGRKALGHEKTPGFTPYALRHSFAKRMLDQGFSTAEVKAMLNHKSIKTTEHYVQYSGREVMRIRDKMQEK